MAETVTIYHNTRCSKSRQTLALLRDNGVEPNVIEYLKEPPSSSELSRIIEKLGMEPTELMRTQEKVYRELGIKGGAFMRKELIDMMVENPILIERPIVVKGEKAALGRPPEAVLEIL